MVARTEAARSGTAAPEEQTNAPSPEETPATESAEATEPPRKKRGRSPATTAYDQARIAERELSALIAKRDKKLEGVREVTVEIETLAASIPSEVAALIKAKGRDDLFGLIRQEAPAASSKGVTK